MSSIGNIGPLMRRLLVAITLLSPAFSLAAGAPDDARRALDRRFVELSGEIYKDAARGNRPQTTRHSDIPSLHRRFKELRGQNNIVSAIALLRVHLGLIERNVDNERVADFVETLLHHNEFVTATDILATAKRSGDRFTLSRLSYQFARYHMERQDWQVALAYLKGIHNDLDTLRSQHALILNGTALQKLKRHRESIKIYEQIPANSPYYAHARLNTAIAHIRQDWWTDARIILDETLRAQPKNEDRELRNRLYLVLGYLLLHKEYYRDAREAFRNIALDSVYANRALLGLGLSAGGQDDFAGALNALTVLKRRNSFDLPTDESYVLLPFVYQKLNQSTTASAGYTEAMTYFEVKLTAIEELLKRENYGDVQASVVAGHEVALGGMTFDLEDAIPGYIHENVRNLNRLRNDVTNPKHVAQVDLLLRDYARHYDDAVRLELEQRRKFLRSYLNQCRFGLARLFDKNEAPN